MTVERDATSTGPARGDGRDADDGRDTSSDAVEAEIEALRQRIRDLGKELRDGPLRARLRQHPFVVLAGAMATGFLIGRLIRRTTTRDT